jgi:hypothetical protein
MWFLSLAACGGSLLDYLAKVSLKTAQKTRRVVLLLGPTKVPGIRRSPLESTTTIFPAVTQELWPAAPEPVCL